MNLSIETTLEKSINLAANSIATHFDALQDIGDPTSSWHQLRLTEMNDVDYLFIPSDIAQSLQSPAALQNFLVKTTLLLNSNIERVTLVTYTNNLTPKFTRYSIEWNESKIKGFDIQNLEYSAQNEFIGTLFEHSEDFITE